MPTPRNRTRSRKRVSKTSPGGGRAIAYRQRTAGPACCLVCGRPLAGPVHLSRLRATRLSKSKKRIWRPYGGQLCHGCLRTALRQATR